MCFLKARLKSVRKSEMACFNINRWIHITYMYIILFSKIHDAHKLFSYFLETILWVLKRKRKHISQLNTTKRVGN